MSNYRFVGTVSLYVCMCVVSLYVCLYGDLSFFTDIKIYRSETKLLDLGSMSTFGTGEKGLLESSRQC